MTKNLLTGESTVLSTATVPTEELNKHTGLKVFDDGRKCVYALNSQEVLSLTIYSFVFVFAKENYENAHCSDLQLCKDIRMFKVLDYKT